MHRTYAPVRAVMLAASLVLAPACTESESPEEIRDEVEASCEKLCPKRVDCVSDEAFASVEECLESCTDVDAAWFSQNQCGRAARNSLACVAEVSCEDLPKLVDVDWLDREDRPCAEESRAWGGCDPDEP